MLGINHAGQRSLLCEVEWHPCFLGNHNDAGSRRSSKWNPVPGLRIQRLLCGRGWEISFSPVRQQGLSICDYGKQGCQLGLGSSRQELLILCSWRKGFPVGSAPTVSGSAAPAHFINSWILLSPSTTQLLQAWVPDMSSFDLVVSDVSFGGFDRGQITGRASICIWCLKWSSEFV